MMPAEIRAAAARIVQRTCSEQNVPVVVEDPAVLARVAALLSGRGNAALADGATDSLDTALLLREGGHVQRTP